MDFEMFNKYISIGAEGAWMVAWVFIHNHRYMSMKSYVPSVRGKGNDPFGSWELVKLEYRRLSGTSIKPPIVQLRLMSGYLDCW